jgi:hypothetical protein
VRGDSGDGIDVIATILILGVNNVICFALGAMAMHLMA